MVDKFRCFFEVKLTDLEVHSSLSDLLIRDYSFNVVPKPFYEMVAGGPISDEDLSTIRSSGFSIKPVAENINCVDVNMRPFNHCSMEVPVISFGTNNPAQPQGSWSAR